MNSKLKAANVVLIKSSLFTEYSSSRSTDNRVRPSSAATTVKLSCCKLESCKRIPFEQDLN